MSLEMLLAQFDGLIQTPADVAQLNETILDWAVRGKLVLQDPQDEPASELLKRIAAEKARLVQEGKIRAEKPLPPVREEEVPYELPAGWVWTYLGNLVLQMGSGSTPKGGKNVYTDSGVKFIRSQNVWNEGLYLDDVAYISCETHERMKRTEVCPKDVLLNITGASIGRSAIVPDDFDRGNVNQHVMIIRFTEPKLRFFQHKTFISSYFQRTIMEVQVGISREGLSKASLYRFPVPIPPLEEQRRIVAKVEELFAQTERLAGQLAAAEEARRRLHTAAVQRLTAPTREKDGARAAWELLAEQFDALYTEPETIEALKQAILQLAVQGRLVRQDPHDEPASELLKRIAAAKARLVEEGKIRAEKPLPPVREEDVPYEVPANWIWVRFPEIGEVNPRNYIDDDCEVSFIPMSLIPTEYHEELQTETRLWGEIRNGFTHFQELDVGFAKITPCFQNRKSVVMRGLRNGIGAGTTELHVFRGNPDLILPDYVLLFFKSRAFIDDAVTKMTGTAGQKRVPTAYFRTVAFPLPPFDEQERIVAKVEELFAQTERLVGQLAAAAEARERLLAAVLAGARGG